MEKLNVHPGGFKIMSTKFRYYRVILENVDNRAASIIKQEMLSLGGEAVISQDVSRFREGSSSVILLGTEKILINLKKKLSSYPFPFGLTGISKEIGQTIENYSKNSHRIVFADGSVWETGRKTCIMGVLNVTPDSFSDGGKFMTLDAALAGAEAMVNDGADIIDVGGESTRPGSEPVSAEEELKRVIPVIKAIKKKCNIRISIDTYKSGVAREAIQAGADMVNDVSGFTFDAKMAGIVASAGVPAVVMHMHGNPKTMQNDPRYDDLMSEISLFLRKSMKKGAEAGIDSDKIIVDPGIGFGKTVEHNLEIIGKLGTLKSLGRPILIGISRKSFIGKILNVDVSDRLEGGLAATAVAIMNGASIIRTHDVRETAKVAAMLDSIHRQDE
ncbi:MAG: dihydropteroate synthase [Acidobacteriota bacterium]